MSSEILMSTANYHFTFSIPITKLDDFNSPRFELGGVQWTIKGERVNRDYDRRFDNDIALSLVCLYDDVNVPKWWVKAGGKITILSTRTAAIERRFPWTRFRRERSEAVATQYVPRAQIMDSVDQGEFKIQVKLDSTPLRKERGQYGVEITKTDFEMTLHDLNNFTAFNTKRFEFRGTEWFIELREENKYLGLFLHHDDPMENWNWYSDVELKVKILYANEEKTTFMEKKFQKRYSMRDKVFGWPDFIKLADLIAKDTVVYAAEPEMKLAANLEISISVDDPVPIWD